MLWPPTERIATSNPLFPYLKSIYSRHLGQNLSHVTKHILWQPSLWLTLDRQIHLHLNSDSIETPHLHRCFHHSCCLFCRRLLQHSDWSGYRRHYNLPKRDIHLSIYDFVFWFVLWIPISLVWLRMKRESIINKPLYVLNRHLGFSRGKECTRCGHRFKKLVRSFFLYIVSKLFGGSDSRTSPSICIISGIIVFRIEEVGVFVSNRIAEIDSIERDFIKLVLGWTIV